MALLGTTPTPPQLPADNHDNNTVTKEYVSMTHTQTMTLKKLTPTGTNGQMVFKNGVLISYTAPT
jgi:hypothetical protein